MMSKHPYEFGGILFSIAIISGLLGGIAGQQMGAADFVDNGLHEYAQPHGSGSGSGGTWIGHDYYEDNSNKQLSCKMQATNLQEFYECVNK